jgi:Predicted membrane protein (DUF2306)
MTAVEEQESTRTVVPGADGVPKQSAWRKQWWVALLAIYCIGFAIYGAQRYVTLDPSMSRANPPRPDVPIQYPMLAIHVITGAIAISLAWMQVWPWLRDNHPRVHRRIGWVYFLAGAFPSALLAIPVAILSTAGQATRLGLFTLGVLWLSTTVAGFVAALQGRYVDHRRWMLRNVALATSIITARPIFYANFYLLSWLLSAAYAHQPRILFTETYASGIWGALVVHLVFVEWFVLRPRRRTRRAAKDRRVAVETAS